MPAAQVLFVSHASRLAGAELVLLDVVQAFRGGRAFLFEEGPLRSALAAAGISSVVPSAAGGFTTIKRDRSLWRALPLLGGLARTVVHLARAARGAEVVYANSQKAFALAAPACAIARRPLVWHLHDILSPAHFGRGQIKLATRLANGFASRVIVPSKAAADAFTAAGGKPGLLRIVPNGLDDVGAPAVAGRPAHGLEQAFVFGSTLR